MENSSNGFDRRSKQRFMIVSRKRGPNLSQRGRNNWEGRQRELNSFSCCLLSSSLNFLLSRTKKKFDRRRRGNRNCRPEVEASTDPDMRSCIKDDIEPINRSGRKLESLWGATWSSCDPDVVMKELSDFNWRRRFSVLIPFDSKYEKKLQPCHSQQQQLWKTHVTKRVKVLSYYYPRKIWSHFYSVGQMGLPTLLFFLNKFGFFIDLIIRFT